MADITYNQELVVPSSTARQKLVVAGEEIVPGQSVYLDPSDSKYKLSDANIEAKKSCDGIALTHSRSGQSLVIFDTSKTDTITLGGASMTAGTIVVVSPNNAGGLAPASDLASGDYVTVIGIATAATTLRVQPINSGIAHG